MRAFNSDFVKFASGSPDSNFSNNDDDQSKVFD